MQKCYLRLAQAPVAGGFRMDGYWVWCGSVVADPSGGYQMFAARWPKNYPMFEGYIYLSEIVRAWSPLLTGPYEFVEKVLPAQNSPGWCGRMAHNPTIVRYGEKFLLYFIGSTYDFPVPPGDDIAALKLGKDSIYANIRIGLAIADKLTGPWQVMENPVLLTRPGKWDEVIVTNPAPCILPDGRIFLYYRSNTPHGLRLGVAVASAPEGSYERLQDKPILEGYHVEDPFVWHDGNRFKLLAKDISGEITDGEKNCGAYFVSDDGVNWKCGNPRKGYSRTQNFDNGQTVTLGCVERPQIFFDSSGKPECFFAATGDGPGHFTKTLNTWNMAVPIKGLADQIGVENDRENT